MPLKPIHHYRATEAENAADVINAGVDLNCGSGFKALGEAVERGLVQEATIDRALTHLWGIRKRLGLDGEYSPHHTIKPDQIHTDQAHELALRAAHETIVLLKNKNNVLPFDTDKTLAVIGPNADVIESLRGNYHGVMIDPVTPLQGLRDALGTEQIVYAQGSMLADGVFITIPETALRTEKGNVGLTGEYFTNGNFNGKPVLTRNDRVVNLDLQNTSPLPALDDNPYSIRWRGLLTPPAPGEYELSVQLENCWECGADEHDTVQLLFNHQKIIAKAGANDTKTLAARVVFKDMTPQPIQLDFQHWGDWGIRLQWRAPRDAQRDEALAANKSADAVVAFMGLSPDLEG
ncbi:MAG: PA14 domain-containing protein, partial [Exilibacterium sp.]